MSRPAPDKGRVERLTAFSLDRRITILVLFVTLLVVGAMAALRIPLKLIPAGFQAPFLAVYVPWRDAPAPEVLEKIVLPMEEELSGIRGLDSVGSTARMGVAWVSLRFKQGTDMSVAYRELRDRLERVRGRLPEDADRLFIRKHDTSDFPVAVYGLAVDPSLTDVYDLIQNEVVLPLSRVDGVASVEVSGLEEKEILIELDRAKTQAAGLNIYEMAQDLGSDNFTLASGHVNDGERKLLLRSVPRYRSMEELEDRLVAPSVRLKDVARIAYEEPEKTYSVRVNSKPAYAVVVFKEGQANTMAVSRRLNEAFEKAQVSPRLQRTEMIPLIVQGDVIKESLDTLLQSGKVGGLFAIGVLFVFLRRFRMTAIITLSIPLSLVVGLTAMYFTGETLNILSLLGLMICVGLLVDNSVVVAENIHRLHRTGLSRREACLRGAGEISLAITTATLTTIVVFLPVALLARGPAQFLMLRLALPICVSLTASLFVALVFVPLAVYLTLSNGVRQGNPTAWRRLHERLERVSGAAYEATLERLNRVYVRLLGLFLHRRLDLVVVLLLVFGGSMYAASELLKITEQQEEERAGFEIDVELSRSTTLAEATEYFRECEKVIEAKQQELGLEGYFIFHRATYGEVEGWFTTPRTSDLKPREVTRIVKEALPKKPGIKFYTGQESETEEEKGKNKYVIPLEGDDYERVESVAQALEDVLLGIDGVLGVKKQADRPTEELALVVDREGARRYGVNPIVVAGVVGYAIRGTALPRYYRDGKEIPVRVRFRKADREGLAEIQSFEVPTATGGVLPVSAITNPKVLPTYRGIFRRDKRITRTITLELEAGREKETRARLNAVASSLELPEGISVGHSSGRRSFNEDVAALQFAGVLSMVFIFLLMCVLFESFWLPLSILFTIPLAAIGVVWIHIALGMDVDMLGVVGGVLLVGVVVNNGIVLVDYVNKLRARGNSRDEAVLKAAERRFRPIMMTALTTICGMIPLTAAGASSIGWSYTSFGLTLIGGMSTATLLTLLVVPVFYTLFDDLRQVLMATLKGALARGTSPRSSPQA